MKNLLMFSSLSVAFALALIVPATASAQNSTLCPPGYVCTPTATTGTTGATGTANPIPCAVGANCQSGTSGTVVNCSPSNTQNCLPVHTISGTGVTGGAVNTGTTVKVPVVYPNTAPPVQEKRPIDKPCPVGCTCDEYLAHCPNENSAPTAVSVTIPSKIGINPVSITQGANGSTIVSGNVTIMTKDRLVIEKNLVKLQTADGDKTIKVLPEEASATAKAVTSVKSITLSSEKQGESTEPVYSVNGTTEAKLFFVIPVTMNIETKVNADNGTVISVSRPWWSFLAK